MSSHDHGHGPKAPDVDLDQLVKLGYDTRDVALNTLVKWLVFLFVFIAGTTLVTMVLYNFFVPRRTELERIAPLAVATEGRRLPPNPQLQARPVRDMIQFRRAEERVIDGYTYTAQGQVAVPIDQAIDELATRGIAGIKGTKMPVRGTDYPGSGNFAPVAGATSGGHGSAHDTSPSDMTNAAPGSSSNAVTDGDPEGTVRGGSAEPGVGPNVRPGGEPAAGQAQPAAPPAGVAPHGGGAGEHGQDTHGGAHGPAGPVGTEAEPSTADRGDR